MASIRSIRLFLIALAGFAWLPMSYADTPCFTPGPLAQTYAIEAASHPVDDTIGTARRVHAYQFSVSQFLKLCSIGYEAPSSPPPAYQFKLYNCNSGVAVAIPGASVTVPGSTFSPGLQYYILPGSWGLAPGNCYEIRRIVMGPSTAAQRKGRRLINETSYPINAVPAITILGTNFFNSVSGPQIPNSYLPFIEFGTR